MLLDSVKFVGAGGWQRGETSSGGKCVDRFCHALNAATSGCRRGCGASKASSYCHRGG